MLKKALATITLCSVSTLSIPVAHAAMPGFYVSGQLGYAQTHMEDKTKNLLALLNSPTTKIKFKVDGKNNIGNDGLAGRLAIGYQFNYNFALEMGYLQLQPGKTGTFYLFNDSSDKDPSAQLNATLNEYAFDIAAKGMIPLANNFNVYGKLGVAYLKSTTYGKAEKIQKNEDRNSKKTNIEETERQFAPEIVVGVSYALTPNVSLDTSLTHIHTFSKDIGNIDFAAIGLTYHFG